MFLIKKAALHSTDLHVECSRPITFFIMKSCLALDKKYFSFFKLCVRMMPWLQAQKQEVNLILLSVGAIVEKSTAMLSNKNIH